MTAARRNATTNHTRLLQPRVTRQHWWPSHTQPRRPAGRPPPPPRRACRAAHLALRAIPAPSLSAAAAPAPSPHHARRSAARWVQWGAGAVDDGCLYALISRRRRLRNPYRDMSSPGLQGRAASQLPRPAPAPPRRLAPGRRARVWKALVRPPDRVWDSYPETPTLRSSAALQCSAGGALTDRTHEGVRTLLWTSVFQVLRRPDGERC